VGRIACCDDSNTAAMAGAPGWEFVERAQPGQDVMLCPGVSLNDDRMARMSANTKKILIVAIVALVLFFLITKPTQSADAVHNVLGWLRNGADAIVTFVRSLFS
jgi:hypothetical protein